MGPEAIETQCTNRSQISTKMCWLYNLSWPMLRLLLTTTMRW